MKPRQVLQLLLSRFLPAAACLVGLAPLSAADNHKWEIKELFSSADEQVQFIELFNTDKDEEHLSLTHISTASGSFFAFPNNLPSPATENRHVLIATAAFAAIPGMPAPDYVIPAGFLEHLGDTLTYAAGPDVVVFGALPVDGVKSINASGAQAVNSPTNFANATGSVTLATATVRNGAGVNVLCYSSVPPALGKPWSATVSVAHHPGATGVLLGGYALPASGPTFGVGQLLMNVGSHKYFSLNKPASGGQAQFSTNMPALPALVGRTIATQAVIYGGSLELTNAVDMKTGW